jgi:hypothetical protein
VPYGHYDIAPHAAVRYCAATYERDLSCVDCQQLLDARYQGPRPLALARLTISPAGIRRICIDTPSDASVLQCLAGTRPATPLRATAVRKQKATFQVSH